MNTQTETFVIDLRSSRKEKAPRRAKSKGRAGRGQLQARKSALRVEGERIRTQSGLRSIFLAERGARRPTVFVSSTATHLASLAEVAHHEAGNLRLFLFEAISPARKEYLQTLFRTVVSVGGELQLLEPEELADVLSAENRGDLFVGGAVNADEQVLVLYRGSFDRLAVPLTWFRRESDVEPDFDNFAVLDYGQTIRFGPFEVSSDAILYDFDPEYRARAKKRQLEVDQSLGGSIRRLRELRGLKRSDFRAVSAKEVARIERSEVKKPRDKTLKAIARRLGVSPEELATY